MCEMEGGVVVVHVFHTHPLAICNKILSFEKKCEEQRWFKYCVAL